MDRQDILNRIEAVIDHVDMALSEAEPLKAKLLAANDQDACDFECDARITESIEALRSVYDDMSVASHKVIDQYFPVSRAPASKGVA